MGNLPDGRGKGCVAAHPAWARAESGANADAIEMSAASTIICAFSKRRAFISSRVTAAPTPRRSCRRKAEGVNQMPPAHQRHSSALTVTVCTSETARAGSSRPSHVLSRYAASHSRTLAIGQPHTPSTKSDVCPAKRARVCSLIEQLLEQGLKSSACKLRRRKPRARQRICNSADLTHARLVIPPACRMASSALPSAAECPPCGHTSVTSSRGRSD